jgi:phosphoribosylformylglycinamidine cyclo-ligase
MEQAKRSDSEAGLSAAVPADQAGQISYRDAGVDILAGARMVEKIRDAVRSTYTPEVIGDIGGFGGLFSAAAFKDMTDPVLVSSTDGVGTKLELARRLKRHQGVGIDLVAMCVNDLVVSGAKPLFFLDYLAVGKLDDDFVSVVVAGVAEGCRQAGCALIGGETAEHPGVMEPDEYDMAGFAVGVVERAEILQSERVRVGDKIIGLASSGLHSNGYSLVRKAWTDTLSDHELNETLLADGRSLADAVLAPTTIYVKTLLQALDVLGWANIRSAAHITGGGISENLNRALPKGLDALIDLGSWPVPEIIQLVIEAANLEPAEALKTFNMGIGMAVIVAPEVFEQAIEYFSNIGAAWHIGQVISGLSADHDSQVLYRQLSA